MMPLYKEEIHGRDFLLNFAEMMTETTLHHGTEAHPQNTFHTNDPPLPPPRKIPPLRNSNQSPFHNAS